MGYTYSRKNKLHVSEHVKSDIHIFKMSELVGINKNERSGVQDRAQELLGRRHELLLEVARAHLVRHEPHELVPLQQPVW